MTPSDPTRDPDQHPTLADHERHLVEFGRYMLARDRTPDNTDWAIVGRLAAFVINGIPAVRAALTPPPSLDVERLRAEIEAELALTPRRKRPQFDAGAAAAYHFVLSLLVSTHDPE